MKSLICILVSVLLITSCNRPAENAADNQKRPDSLNQVLYTQVMEVHDEIMPNMEKIYKLKQEIEVQIANTDRKSVV